jgi:uncharacterized protein (DUF2141 family)
MPSLHTRRVISLLVLLFICVTAVHAQNIEVLFTDIRSTRGQIVVKIFKDDKSFQDDKPYKTVKFNKNSVANGSMSGKLTLDPGIYGFALLDDENGDNEMENNFVGMPKEGFGFSNFYLTGLRKPKFEEFKFLLNKDQKLNINMKIRYL